MEKNVKKHKKERSYTLYEIIPFITFVVLYTVLCSLLYNNVMLYKNIQVS